ncbi:MULTISPECIES: ABC transporter permease [Pseudothermotoga]|uniref:Inner-membrane translocator n=1 Tax=Pseudothermotoga lettingae (strain ATCC BAA-301 / DSM 14385 / NBRC 107922 / TMO) TaxID=416591 RepID=A8F627_PSELT|nr:MULTISPECIES: ABC transporter permease [Pseudothermotoga]ABV33611.1 inner-membrane translocator [Pseudothermotoga lettingae TMO]KUK21561.1 MAG: Inner-membrane translocator [Pseudothermotoga lettingae]MDI3495063.1 ral nucleoside transport system permease protein [Pseudothermotoga sp.]MDK2883739.1 ral nucleoside transport system permease protein [Pseudothermotoga sp.]GLI49473.1 ABC transporter permease [Pseudothermotoga lettingae TMO]
MNSKVWAFIVPAVSVLIALLISSVIIMLIGQNPITAYAALFKGAFGSKLAIASTIVKTTPLILTGLAVGFGFRAGLFNIGAEGQMIVGAMIATAFAINISWMPAVFAIPLTMIVGMLAGAGYAAIAGILKAKTGAHEVVTTIMLNWIAEYLSTYVVTVPMGVGLGTPKSPEIANSAKLPPIMTVQATELTSGIIVAVLAAIVMYIVLEKTTKGYELKATGFNIYAAEYGGISISRNIVLAMAISGALSGLAGTLEVMGVHHRFLGTLSGGKGFDGISIALIGQNNPIGIVFAALLMGSLRTGSNEMQFVGVPKHIILIVQAIVIFLVAADRIVRTILIRKKKVMSQ